MLDSGRWILENLNTIGSIAYKHPVSSIQYHSVTVMFTLKQHLHPPITVDPTAR